MWHLYIGIGWEYQSKYQSLCDGKLRIMWHRQKRNSWFRVCIPRHGPIFHLHMIIIWQMKNTYMHFEEQSIIYIWSKFQFDTCMFDSNILLTKFGPGFWFRSGRWFRVLFFPNFGAEMTRVRTGNVLKSNQSPVARAPSWMFTSGAEKRK